MRFPNFAIGLLLAVATVKSVPTDNPTPVGYAEHVTGGEGGVVYHVNTLKELKDALKNNGKPNDPKIIYIDSPIDGYIYDDGTQMTDENLAPGYSFEKYIKCFNEAGTEWLGTPECEKIAKLRKNGMKPLQNQIKVRVTSNTSIIGKGDESRLEELVIQIGSVDNVILRNLSIQAPNDLFPEWTMNDGWNTKYDAVVVQTSTNVWIDNCLVDDGKRPVESEPIYFGEHVERHDGLIDIVNGSDLVTISNCRFANHKKAILIGNSDSRTTDRDHLRVTMYNNVFINCWQRMPRVRFGNVHVFNNLYYVDNYKDYPFRYNGDGTIHYIHIFLGLGLESNIFSEYNSFNYPGLKSFEKSNSILLEDYGGYHFNDVGSRYNGHKYNFNELAKKTFEATVQRTIANNKANGKTNPEWVNATFTTETFKPSDIYKYTVERNIRNVNKLINKVPTWMFENSDSDSSDSDSSENNNE